MRLIDADAICKECVEELLVATCENCVIKDHKINKSIDAVPVVRCKDCVHWLNEDGLEDHVCLKIYSDGAVSSYAWQFREPNDFCSYGKRKDGE